MAHFKQKHMARRIKFDFEDHELRFYHKDNSGIINTKLDYADIHPGSRIVFDHNRWVRNVGILWCVIALAQIFLAILDQNNILASFFWLALGGGCLVFYYLTQSTYTVIETQKNRIFIQHDSQHDEISEMIQTRRKARIMKLFGHIDLANDPNQEINKVEWLVRQDVLSRDDADTMIARIDAEHKNLVLTQEKVLADRKLH